MNKSLFTKEQAYTLDTIGMCVFRQFLPSAQLRRVSRLITERLDDLPHAPYKFEFFDLDPVFCELMSHPWVVAACKTFLGDQFRFDHCMGIQQPGSIKMENGKRFSFSDGNIHGGSLTNQGSVFQVNQGGTTRFGQLGLGISLSGQCPSSGGFCYVPGSHKQSAKWGNGTRVFSKILKSCYTSDALVIPKLNPGDAFLFPDHLVHGTTPLSKSFYRRALYYKYTPGFAAWRPFEQIKHYSNYATTELQRKMLRPPFVAEFEGDVEISDNKWKKAT